MEEKEVEMRKSRTIKAACRRDSPSGQSRMSWVEKDWDPGSEVCLE